MADKEFPLALVIKAVDKATAPLRRINERIQKFTAPVRSLGNSFRALSDAAGLPQIAKGFKGVGSALGNVGRETFALGAKVLAMGSVAGFALFHIVKGAVDAGDELSTMSQRVGLSVDAYAQLQFAAAQADVDQDQFNGSMDQFNKRLGQAKQGLGPLKALGPVFFNQLRGAKDTEAAFGLAIKAIQKMKSPSEKAALAAELFGKSGLQMGQFLGQGTEAIEAQRAEAARLLGPQQKLADGASVLDNEMRKVGVAFLSLRNAAAGALFPALTELSKALTNVVAGNRESLAKWAREAGEALSAWIKRGDLYRLVEGLKGLAATAGKVIDFLGGLKGVAIAAAAVMAGPLLMAVGGLAVAAVNLGIALAPLGVALVPFIVAAAPFILAASGVALVGYQIWKNWSDIKLLFADGSIVDSLKALSNPLGMVFGKGGPSDAEREAEQVKRTRMAIARSAEFGASSAAPTRAAPATQGGQTRVVVDFSNVPKGVRVTPDRGGTADLDLSVGPAMVGG